MASSESSTTSLKTLFSIEEILHRRHSAAAVAAAAVTSAAAGTTDLQGASTAAAGSTDVGQHYRNFLPSVARHVGVHSGRRSAFEKYAKLTNRTESVKDGKEFLPITGKNIDQ